MTFTVLAIVFLLLLLTVAIVGYRMLSQKTAELEASASQSCSICKKPFDTSELIERQVADYKVMYFCGNCIRKLARDLERRAAEPEQILAK